MILYLQIFNILFAKGQGLNIIRSYKWSRSGVVSEVSGVDNLDRVIFLFLDSHS